MPVVTGIGHEIDFTIADFVADRREPTPSAAAENAAPDGTTLLRHLGRLRDAVEARTEGALALHQRHLLSLRREIEAREPGRKLRSWAQTLDFLEERLDYLVAGRLQRAGRELAGLRRSLAAIQPERTITRGAEETAFLASTLDRVVRRRLSDLESRIRSLGGLMHSLSPDAVLKRGFSITTDEAGHPVTSAKPLRCGDRLRTRFADGEVVSRVE